MGQTTSNTFSSRSTSRSSFIQSSASGNKLSSKSKGALGMMHSFGMSTEHVSPSRSTDASSSSEGSPRPSLPPSSFFTRADGCWGTTSGNTTNNSRSQEDPVAAIRRAHRFFDGLDNPNRWSQMNGSSSNALAVGATATAAVPRRSRSRNGRQTATAKTNQNRSHSSGGRLRRQHHQYASHSPSLSQQGLSLDAAPRTPSRPVKCPPRSGQGMEAYHYPMDGNLHEANAQAANFDDTEDAQYLKRLYEMRTWDMYCRITDARKHNPSLYSVGGCGGGTRSHVPGPTVEIESHGGWTTAMAAEHQASVAALTDGELNSSDHEMIFSCDME